MNLLCFIYQHFIVYFFFQLQHGQTRDDLLNELANVKKEKEAFLLQIGMLSTELEKSQKQVEISNRRCKENENDTKMVYIFNTFVV